MLLAAALLPLRLLLLRLLVSAAACCVVLLQSNSFQSKKQLLLLLLLPLLLLLVRLNLLVFACLIPWRAPPCVCRGRRIYIMKIIQVQLPNCQTFGQQERHGPLIVGQKVTGPKTLQGASSHFALCAALWRMPNL